jgi:hypothetical protein
MNSLDHFDETFEPALIEEMNKFGELKYFNEGGCHYELRKLYSYDAHCCKGNCQSILNG